MRSPLAARPTPAVAIAVLVALAGAAPVAAASAAPVGPKIDPTSSVRLAVPPVLPQTAPKLAPVDVQKVTDPVERLLPEPARGLIRGVSAPVAGASAPAPAAAGPASGSPTSAPPQGGGANSGKRKPRTGHSGTAAPRRSHRSETRASRVAPSPDRSGAGTLALDDGAATSSGEGSTGGVIRHVVDVLPGAVKAALAALASISLILGVMWLLERLRIRRLGRQRHELLEDADLLQETLLPAAPERLGCVSVCAPAAPADGEGHFHDIFRLDPSRVAVILGIASGKSPARLSAAALMRHALRAYVDGGLEPLAALELARESRAGVEVASALIAVHDESRGTLTYAWEGRPPAFVCTCPLEAPAAPDAATLSLPRGSIACFYVEPVDGSDPIDRRRLAQLIHELGDDASAPALLELLGTDEAVPEHSAAACLIRPGAVVHDLDDATGRPDAPTERRKLASVRPS